MTSPPSAPVPRLRYITSTQAASLDAQLMGRTYGFTLAQLMELAGLACARCVYRCYPPHSHPSVLVASGPGNQGGDGLVAARWLRMWGYQVGVWYPKQGKGEVFEGLVKQLHALDVDFVAADEASFYDALEAADSVLDCIFGFSFKGEPRDPYALPLKALMNESLIEFEARKLRAPVISVDIPSGWPVDDTSSPPAAPPTDHFMPQVILSLTAPKGGVRSATLPHLASGSGNEAAAAAGAGFEPIRHFIGGRFVPPALEAEYALHLPPFEADQDLVEVTGWGEISEEEARAALEAEEEEEYDDAEEEGEETQETTPAKSESKLEEKMKGVELGGAAASS